MTDLFRVLVTAAPEIEGVAEGTSHFRPTQTAAFADAVALRKLGVSTEVRKVTLKKLPLKDLLSNLFNHEDEAFVAEEVVVKATAGVKHPKGD